MTIHVDSRAVALTSTPAVYTRNGAVYASSRDVAAFFGKQHKHVLDSIKALLAEAPSTEPNFRLSEYRDSTGRTLPAYEMTRDGFTLLAMGFTGKTALAFKVRYIEEFNRMEAQLKAAPQAPQLPNFMDPGEAAIAWGEQFKARQLAETRMLEAQKEAAEQAKAAEQCAMVARIATEKLVDAAPKVNFYDTLVEAEGCITSTEAAAILGWSARFLHEKLEACGHVKRIHGKEGGKRASGWRFTPHMVREGRGITASREFAGSVTHQLLWSPKGIAWLQARAVSAPVNRRRRAA